MANSFSFVVPELTEEQIELVTQISVASFLVVSIALVIFIGCLVWVAFKTKLPGRFLTLTSGLIIILLIGFTEFMGGNLEWVLGPIGALYTAIVYSVALTLFSIGFYRMCSHIRRTKGSNHAY